jgi:hypothetical protein
MQAPFRDGPLEALTGTGGDMSSPKIIDDRRLLKLCADGMMMVRVPNRGVFAHQSTNHLEQRTGEVRGEPGI